MEWYTPEDVAKKLKVSRATAYKLVNDYIKSGGDHWRPTKRITRVPEEQFTQFLIQRKQ